MNVLVVKEGHLLIALWSMDLIQKCIRMELDDVPTEEFVLTGFPPHGLHDPMST